MRSYPGRPWYTKPPVGARIDRSHSIANGLVEYWLCNDAFSSASQMWGLVKGYTNALTVASGVKRDYTAPWGMTFDPASAQLSVADSNDFHMSTTTGGTLGHGDVATQVCWFRMTNSGAPIFITGKCDPGGSHNGYLVFYDNGSGKLTYDCNNSANVSRITGPSVIDSKWHQLAIVFRVKGNNTVKLYLDGNFIGSNTISGDITLTTQPLTWAVSSDTFWTHLQGNLEPGGWWNRELDPTEILTLYNDPFCFIEPNGIHKFAKLNAAGSNYNNSITLASTTGFTVGAAGSTYNVPLTLGSTTGFIVTPNNVIGLGLTFGSTTGFGTSWGNATNWLVSVSLGSTTGFTPSVQANDNPALTLGSTTGFTPQGGLNLTAALTLGSTTGFVTAQGQYYTASLTLASTTGFTATGAIGAYGSITLPSTTGLSSNITAIFNPGLILGSVTSFTPVGGDNFSISLTLGSTTGFATSGGYNFTTDQVTLGSTTGFSTSYIYVSVLYLNSTTGFTVSAGFTVNPMLTLASTTGFIVAPSWVTTKPVSNTLVLRQTLTSQNIKNRSVSNTLSLAQLLQKGALIAPNNHLTFSQTLAVVRVRNQSVSNQLMLSQALIRTGIRNYAFQHQLFFNTNFSRGTPLGNYVQNRTNADYTIVSPRCFVILQSSNQTVVLRCAELGDTEAFNHSVNIKRAMDNTVYAYVKSSPLEKLHYVFKLGRIKSLELRDFYLKNLATPFLMKNWKGETWVVYFGNNPLDLVAKDRWFNAGERIDVAVEFEGMKIQG